MLEELKERICTVNKALPANNLCLLTWGNVSAIDRESGHIVIKPSGVPFAKLTAKQMSVVDLGGKLIEGDPSSNDTLTHLELYHSFPTIGGICHTHSRWATIMAQIGIDIPVYGASHAGYFQGDIPCTKPLTNEQIQKEYRRETAMAIARALYERKLAPERVNACLAVSHGAYAWGANERAAVQNAIVLEEVAMAAWHIMQAPFKVGKISGTMIDEHYFARNSKQLATGEIPAVV